MEQNKSNSKANMIYGLAVIVPVAVVIVIFAQLIEVLEKVAKVIGLHTTFGAGLAVILALVFLLIVCYVTGALVHTRIGALSFEKFEKKLLLQIPGYQIISNIFKGFAEEQIESYPPALVQLGPPGTQVVGFVMDENANGTLTVFVPSVPALTVGSLHIVEQSRVTLLDAGHLDVVNCITEWGVGSRKFIGQTRHQKTTT